MRYNWCGEVSRGCRKSIIGVSIFYDWGVMRSNIFRLEKRWQPSQLDLENGSKSPQHKDPGVLSPTHEENSGKNIPFDVLIHAQEVKEVPQ